MTKIVHCKKEFYDIYIGRPSIYGNPYIIGKDGTREEVIEKYIVYLLEHPEIDLTPLKDKVLGCWCKPADCHGDIIVAILDGGKYNAVGNKNSDP